jgi:hypothetical protein
VAQPPQHYRLLGFLAALFAFSFLALVVTSLVALVVALFAFSFLAALLAFGLLALVFASLTFDGLVFAAHGAIGLVSTLVLAGSSLLDGSLGGVGSTVGGTIVTAASGHRESKCQSGKSGENYFLHFFDVFMNLVKQ